MVLHEQSMTFRIPGAAWGLLLPVECMAFLTKHAQTSSWKREVVGQLYSRDLTTEVISVDAVMKLPSKWSSRAGVAYDRQGAMDERRSMFNDGFHCIGFWHTHPERVPHLSGTDLSMAADHAVASKGTFSGLIFAIVGTASLPEGLGIWLHDGQTAWSMKPEL